MKLNLHVGEANERAAFITSSDTGWDVAMLCPVRHDMTPAEHQLTAEEWQELIDTINAALTGMTRR